MASLIGTVGALGTQLLGDLISKGVQTLGNVANSKLQNWEKTQSNNNQQQKDVYKSIQRQVGRNSQHINQIDTRLKKVEQQMEIE